MAFRPAPLNSSFFLTGIIGFLLSVTYIMPTLSMKWGFAFAVVFLAMIIAALYAMRTEVMLDEHIVPEFVKPIQQVTKKRSKLKRK